MSGVALLLPGQGSQHVGMGRALAEAFPAVRELYERADETVGAPLGRLSWEGPEEELTETENAQPAILLHSYAVWTLVGDAVGEVTVAAGHSLGEFTAHLVAGTFGFEDALRIVRRRGQLMAAAGAERPGAMAAVMGLPADRIDVLCGEVERGVAVAANLNAEGQVVISGDVEAVEAVSAAAAEAGARRVIPLNVSGAFHSPLMAGAAAGLEEALAAAVLSDPGVPVVANATARTVTDAAEARATLVSQLTHPVRWVDVIETMRAREPEAWLELGPGNVLSGLLRRADRSLRPIALGEPEGVETFLSEAASAAAGGGPAAAGGPGRIGESS